MKLRLTASLLGGALASYHKLDWTVTEMLAAPDNSPVGIIAINGMFPGPTINVTIGDTLEINVHNLVSHPFTIHWHGILHRNSPEADGVPYVTQDPIPTNGNYTYNFTVTDQAGTYWYHAHTLLDGEAIYGAFVVMESKEILAKVRYDARFQYDDERTLLLSDLWHTPRDDIYRGLTQAPSVYIGNPQSILTNGRTYAEGDSAARDLPFNTGYSVITVEPNLRYRLRIIGAQGHSFFSFRIPGHSFTVIEADGTLVRPFETDRVEINAGMRYSVILHTKATPKNYYTYTSIIGEGDKVSNGVAILHYAGAPDPGELRTTIHAPPPNRLQISTWFEDQLSTLISHDIEVPTSFTQSFAIVTNPAVEDGVAVHRVNNVRHTDRTQTRLSAVLGGEQVTGPGIVNIRSDGMGVQVIIQHNVPMNQYCAQHPWHIHGHSFYVVARGNGTFDSESHHPLIEEGLRRSPILRDTFTFFPDGTPNTRDNVLAPEPPPNANSTALRSCGWYALRFKANNPGAWLSHCHKIPHMIMGMQFVFNEAPI